MRDTGLGCEHHTIDIINSLQINQIYDYNELILAVSKLHNNTSNKTPASGAEGTRFKPRAHQIPHALPATRHHCKHEVWPCRKPQKWAVGTLTRNQKELNEYHQYLIYFVTNQAFSSRHRAEFLASKFH